jgi:hypothetical protein
MSIFGSIMSKIFSHPAAAAQPGAQVSAQQPPPASGASPSPQSAPTVPPPPAPSTAQDNAAPQTSTAAPHPVVDVEAILAALASSNSQKLDWHHSIVDLLKLLDLDSSFDARKELAHELNYTGDTGDSATMNIWLHRQVMTKLAENGGKVPDDLKH